MTESACKDSIFFVYTQKKEPKTSFELFSMIWLVANYSATSASTAAAS
jgi:hypothetical protein